MLIDSSIFIYHLYEHGSENIILTICVCMCLHISYSNGVCNNTLFEITSFLLCAGKHFAAETSLW